jgi:hypothetical protein
MTEEVNDHNPNVPAANNAANLQMALASFIGPVMTAAVNGCFKTLTTFSIDAIAITMCAILGRCLGMVLSIGDMGPILVLRGKCIEAFKEELRKVPIQAMPKRPDGPMTALPKDSAELVKKIKAES